MPFLPLSGGRVQDNMTFLEPMLTAEKVAGCTVGAVIKIVGNKIK
jgi:hypothetical protein